MRFLILRKRRFFERHKSEKVISDDIEIEIAYIFRVGKKIRSRAEQFDSVLSLDFKEFFVKSNLLFLLAERVYDKIASRHGGVDRDVLEVQVDFLNNEIIEKLTSFALNVRRVLIHSDIAPEEFDFLCDEAGVCPEFESGGYRENLVVHFGEEFLIKHIPTGKIYYDVLLCDRKDFVPEMNMVFCEYLKAHPEELKNVKIRELMSK